MTIKKHQVSWVLQLVSVIILLQTLVYKFGLSPELEMHSIVIFSKIGEGIGLSFIEPYGRYGTGIIELITSILLLIPKAKFIQIGAILGVFTMLGAIVTHLTVLGVEVSHDGGGLFTMAWIVLISCGITFFLRK